jgi:hypothetical protein
VQPQNPTQAQPYAPVPSSGTGQPPQAPVYAPGSMPNQQPPLYAQGPGYAPKKSHMGLIIGIIVAVVVVVAIIIGVVFVVNGANRAIDEVITPPITGTGTGTGTGTTVEDYEVISGEFTGSVGKGYETRWFQFTVDSMTTASSYEGYTADAGYILVIAHVTETNIFGSTQPFGTFDWFVDDSTLTDYIYPLDPFTDDMMPDSFDLRDGETASYDVVIEYPADLANPYFMYIEADEEDNRYATFKIPIR